jgi:hypothetical protein
MAHRRPKSPGSFQDELEGVIERVAPTGPKLPAKHDKPKKRGVSDSAGSNDLLFWRRPDEKA